MPHGTDTEEHGTLGLAHFQDTLMCPVVTCGHTWSLLYLEAGRPHLRLDRFHLLNSKLGSMGDHHQKV